MYNCYNAAIQYMIKTYGEVKVPLSGQNNKMASSYKTDNLDGDGKQIDMLLRQYYYGIEPKKELFYKLLSLGANIQAEA